MMADDGFPWGWLAVFSAIGAVYLIDRNYQKKYRELEDKLLKLEANYLELKAGYTIMAGKIEKLQTEVVELWNLTPSNMPELKKKLDLIYSELSMARGQSVPRLSMVI
jgi:hypothetical protein